MLVIRKFVNYPMTLMNDNVTLQVRDLKTFFYTKRGIIKAVNGK